MKISSATHDKVYAARLQKPTIKDPRLVVGILLILGSILAVVLVLRAGNQTASYYAATHEIAVGQKIEPEDIQLVEVKLSDAQKNTYRASDQTPEGQYATSLIRSGELVTLADTADYQNEARRKVAITLDSAETATLNTGDRVDIWVSSPQKNSQNFEDPHTIMRGAEIASKNSEETLIGGTGKTAVSVLVLDESLPAVLNAVNNEAKINLIPTNYAVAEMSGSK